MFQFFLVFFHLYFYEIIYLLLFNNNDLIRYIFFKKIAIVVNADMQSYICTIYKLCQIIV